MSTNIIRWETKRLENFTVELDVLNNVVTEDEKHRGWGLSIVTTDRYVVTVTINGSTEGFVLKGILLSDAHFQPTQTIQVQDIKCRGEGSGTFYFGILKRILTKTQGVMEATMVWEDGTLMKLTVKDGNVKGETVEL